MSNLNLKTIENVSISEVKELDEFLKTYNKKIELTEVERKASVLAQSNGKLSETQYDSYLSRLKAYTINATIPTESEWAQIRTIYRETGNKKIAKSKEEIELILKEYSGTQSIEDSQFGKITPKQTVQNLVHTEKKVELIKTLKVVVSILAGVAGFVLLTLLSNLLTSLLFSNASPVITQIIAGVLSIFGLLVCAWLANKFMGIFLLSVKRDRDLAEITEANNHEEIVRLQTAIKSAEQNVDRIEAQYGVEILYQSDFSNLVSPPKKLKNELKNEKIESTPQPISEKSAENVIGEEKTIGPKVEDCLKAEDIVEKSIIKNNIEQKPETLSNKSKKGSKMAVKSTKMAKN